MSQEASFVPSASPRIRSVEVRGRSPDFVVVLVGLVDHQADVVGEELRQALVDPSDRVLREERLPELPLDRRNRGLYIAAVVIVLVELLPVQLELEILLPPEPTPPPLRGGVRLEGMNGSRPSSAAPSRLSRERYALSATPSAMWIPLACAPFSWERNSGASAPFSPLTRASSTM